MAFPVAGITASRLSTRSRRREFIAAASLQARSYNELGSGDGETAGKRRRPHSSGSPALRFHTGAVEAEDEVEAAPVFGGR